MKLILLGAPGSGKGTQAEIHSKRLSIPTISTGDIIRKAVKSETEMGLNAKKYIEKGMLVPDEVVIGIIKERLSQEDCNNGYILDGFPRTIAQAEALDEMGIAVDAVINFEAADEDIVKRMAGRRVCKNCGETYHVTNKPSKNGTHCDKCGGELGIRKDDDPAVVRERLEIYHKQTKPLEAYYENKNMLYSVNGMTEISITASEIEKILAKLAEK